MSEVAVFRSHAAVVLWLFMLVWDAMVLLFTWVGLRDGVPPSTSPLVFKLALGAFWLGGIAMTTAVLKMAMSGVTVRPGLVSVWWQWGLIHRRRRYHHSEVVGVVLEEGRDSDGDPWFSTTVRFHDDATVVLARGADREACAAAAARFQAVLGRNDVVRAPSQQATTGVSG